MKAQILTVGIIAGFVMLAGDANAQERPDFATLDANNDGELSIEELQSAGDARFAETDTDGNGMLSLAELTAQSESQAATRAEQFMARWDENEDGALTPEEIRGDRPKQMERMFERADANDDGVLSAEEFEAAKEKRGQRGRRDGRGHGRGRG